MSTKYNEDKLPKWARNRLENLRYENKRLRSLELAHEILMNRRWFTLSGPSDGAEEVYLYTLNEQGAHRVCSLGHKDILVIGRWLKREEQ